MGDCLLYGIEMTGFVVKTKPNTTTTRVLSIDGGGTRGVVTLEFIKGLQDRVGLPYPI
jgi:hypothetical protein